MNALEEYLLILVVHLALFWYANICSVIHFLPLDKNRKLHNNESTFRSCNSVARSHAIKL